MVTIKEIAKHCNVSIATVSNIINGKPNASKETKERVLQAIEELNCQEFKDQKNPDHRCCSGGYYSILCTGDY